MPFHEHLVGWTRQSHSLVGTRGRSISGKLIGIDQRMVFDCRVVTTDAVGQRRPDLIEADQVALQSLPSRDRTLGALLVVVRGLAHRAHLLQE